MAIIPRINEQYIKTVRSLLAVMTLIVKAANSMGTANNNVKFHHGPVSKSTSPITMNRKNTDNINTTISVNITAHFPDLLSGNSFIIAHLFFGC